MLNQAFTADNFRKIFDEENRKGIYLEGRFWKDLTKASRRLKEISMEFKQMKEDRAHGRISDEEYKTRQIELNRDKQCQQEKKEDFLANEFKKISDEILSDNFDIPLRKVMLNSKPLYLIPEKCPKFYFALKQIQSNLRTSYKIKQQTRNDIICQLRVFLGDSLEKWLIKADIKNFYESLDQEKIEEKISSDPLLSFTSQKIIYSILEKYNELTGKKIGVPRGIGVSAYLAELYMRDFDRSVSALPGVFYYARYVDDIIVLRTPVLNETHGKTLDFLKGELGKIGLELNDEKSSSRSSKDNGKDVEYLGYSFVLPKNKDKLKIEISKKRLDKYKKKIDISFVQYEKDIERRDMKAGKYLYKRIKFLTSNTKLVNNKRNVVVGIYFSNRYVNDHAFLQKLDEYLGTKVSDVSESLKEESKRSWGKISKMKFEDGFRKKEFSRFSRKDFMEITRVWKNVE